MVQRARNNRRADIRNIVILGGSTAFGYGVINDKQTISRVLNSMLGEDGYEVFNLAQGGFTSFMDLFSLSAIGLYLEPDIIIVMEGYADIFHLAYKSNGGELAWGLFSGSERKSDPKFAFGFHYQNLDAILRLGTQSDRQVILAFQPLSGFENDSTIDNDKIKKVWTFYPRIREMMRLVAENNGAEFLDLSTIFKEEKNSSINFFDQVHLTVTGQRKVASVFAEKIKGLDVKKTEQVDSFQLREKWIKDILEKDLLGKYKTVEDY
jgi:lysophospholipase L1-like esterase